MFSLYFGDVFNSWSDDFSDTTSKIWLGGYDHDFIRTLDGWGQMTANEIDSKIIWVDLPDDEE